MKDTSDITFSYKYNSSTESLHFSSSVGSAQEQVD